MICKRRGSDRKRLWIGLAIGIGLALNLQYANAADYTIQPEDVVSLQVDGETQLSKNYTLDEKGDITLDSIGSIHLAGLTVKGAEDELSNQLKKYLKIFEVHLSVPEETGGRVLVFGEVGKPGSFKVRSGAKLLDVLADAGQPTPNADTKRIAIIREGGNKTETADLDAILKDPSLNLPLSPGDTVTVPSRITNTVQVDGEVTTPGLRSLDSFKTAYAAILAAGPTPNADWKRVALRRKGSNIPLIVDLTPVREGALKDDLELQPGDQITVMSWYRGSATLRGEIKDPGEKPLKDKTQILDFIRISGGGFTEIADSTSVEILRDGQPVEMINLEDVASGRRSSDDPKLAVLPGDVIFVPNDEKKRFAIVGGVRKPGAYPVKPGMRILDAIFAAEGVSPNASKQFILAPADPNDERFKAAAGTPAPKKSASDKVSDKDGAQLEQNKLILLDFKKIQTGEMNYPLEAGDRILVPEELPRQRRGSFLDSALRLLPFASLFMVR